MAFDGLTDVLLAFGVDIAAIIDGDGTVSVEMGVETDVLGAGSDDGVLFMFSEPPCPTAEMAARAAFGSVGLIGWSGIFQC